MKELLLEAQGTEHQASRPTGVFPDYQCGANTRVRQEDAFDQQYVDLLIQGDPAVEAHFSSHFGKLLTVKLKYRLRSKELAEDARQETFLRVLQVLRNKGGIKNPERLGAFVKAVSENVLLEIFRSGRLDQRRVTDDNDFPSTLMSAESVMISAQRKDFLRSKKFRLNPASSASEALAPAQA